MTKVRYLQAIPATCLVMAGAWHMLSFYHYGGLGDWTGHVAVLGIIFTAGLASLFLRDVGSANELFESFRPQLTGAACFMLGALHFIGLLNAEPLFFQMGFLMLILAYFETAGMANGFRPVYSGHPAQVTENTLKRLVLKQLGTLTMVFALSMILLYLSLMVVVGFRETWTVALLAAAMILALAFLTRARRI